MFQVPTTTPDFINLDQVEVQVKDSPSRRISENSGMVAARPITTNGVIGKQLSNSQLYRPPSVQASVSESVVTTTTTDGKKETTIGGPYPEKVGLPSTQQNSMLSSKSVSPSPSSPNFNNATMLTVVKKRDLYF